MIVVTGARGFVGRRVVDALGPTGGVVRGLVRTTTAESLSGTVAIGDLESADLAPVLLGAKVVIHCAARAHVLREQRREVETLYHRANHDATVRLARAAVAAGVTRFIFLSSIKVLGEATTGRPFRAEDAPAPEDPYGRSKAAAEVSLREITDCGGMELVIIRPPLIYGTGARGNLARLVTLVRRGIPLPFGSVSNRRSLVAVESVAELVASVALAPTGVGGIYHVADLESVSTAAMIRALADGCRRSPRLVAIPPGLIAAAARFAGHSGVARRLLGSLEVDPGETSRRFAWQPRISPLPGLAAMAATA